MVQMMHPITKQRFRFWFENPNVGRPVKGEGLASSADQRLFPQECRESVSVPVIACLYDIGRWGTLQPDLCAVMSQPNIF